jgi:hypothetical protein
VCPDLGDCHEALIYVSKRSYTHLISWVTVLHTPRPEAWDITHHASWTKEAKRHGSRLHCHSGSGARRHAPLPVLPAIPLKICSHSMPHGAAYDIPLELLTYIFTIARRDVTERASWTQPSSDAYDIRKSRNPV